MGKKTWQETYDEVTATYTKTKRIINAAKAAGISRHQAQRILITAGLWSNDKSEKIKILYTNGKRVGEIADLLHMSERNVYRYLPITPSLRNDDLIYIYQKHNRRYVSYYISIRINRKFHSFGFFRNLDDAKKLRDELLEAKENGRLTEWCANYKKKHKKYSRDNL